MRRLHLQFYLAILATLTTFVVATGIVWLSRPWHWSHPGAHFIVVFSSIALAIAIGTYPITRQLTGRLARLQAGVEQLGRGDLTARVRVEGRDEVAALARSFNDAAARIEQLVGAHKLLLANCSHELRTPLARIRLGIERIAGGPDAAVRDELARNIAELDALIGEMLLTSRLNALQKLERVEDVDLLALVAEEAAHFDREVDGQSVIVRGDLNLLRRMTRNLLDNAQRHAGGATRVRVELDAGMHALLSVEDAGNGISETDRGSIFEPFYRVSGRSADATGFGLGLAIVRQIADAHGGNVSYDPLSTGGSRFIVRLPRADG
jgi:signal transduction histidine kinase